MRELRAAELRKKIQSWRKGLPAAEHQLISEAMDRRLLAWFQERLEHSAPGAIWGSYRALPWEWDFPETHRWLALRKVTLVFPRVDLNSEADHLLAWHQADRSQPGHWKANFRFPGLQEPDPALPKVDPGTLYGVIVPGVAFSLLGERIGMGGGFYDRFLSRLPQVLRVAVGAERQVLSSLPEQRWDEPRMHWLITERREFCFVSNG